MKIKLNSDLGESFGAWKMGADELIMPLIDMANVACGFHASDPLTMHKTVKLAIANGVSIGAHPSYPDLVGFGRRHLACSAQEIAAFVTYQCGALEAICASQGAHISYVKPHGALYNDMMSDEAVFRALAGAVASYDKNLKLMILSSKNNAHYEALAGEFGIGLLFEVFADRAYTSEGLLVSRSQAGAVISSVEAIKERVALLQNTQKLITQDGQSIDMRADCICVHGDNSEAVALVRELREYLGR